jgi:uncharacterized protein (TIGR02145 family)
MKTTLILLVIFIQTAITKTHAQDLKISFSGTGAGTTIDSVYIENLTEGTQFSCGGLDVLHLRSNVGIAEINTDEASGISIYPNPMNGACSFEFSTSTPATATILLCNISGQVILKEQSFLPAGHHLGSLGGLASGTYIIKVGSDNYSGTAKFLSIGNNYGGATLKHRLTTRATRIKTMNSDIDFQYTSGDILKLTGQSGNYRTIQMLVPAETQTVSFNFMACTDADSNNYVVVRIGRQWWMAENLRTTKYRNGDIISNVTSNTAWGNLSTGAMSWYNNNPSAYKDIYGGLYNWYAVNDTRNIAPPGWHVATDEEWTALTTYLGDPNTCGGKVKETGFAHWKTPNSGATNVTGFTALPGGYRFLNGTFDEIRGWSVWWCSTSSSADRAPTRAVFYNYFDLGRDLSDKRDGFAIRCIKNQ